MKYTFGAWLDICQNVQGLGLSLFYKWFSSIGRFLQQTSLAQSFIIRNRISATYYFSFNFSKISPSLSIPNAYLIESEVPPAERVVSCSPLKGGEQHSITFVACPLSCSRAPQKLPKKEFEVSGATEWRRLRLFEHPQGV